MSFRQLMKSLGILVNPSSWSRNFKAADKSTQCCALPDAALLQSLCAQVGASEQHYDALLSQRERIAGDKQLLALWRLWYFILFVSKDTSEEQYENWPLPAYLTENDKYVFRALVVISAVKALETELSSRNLGEHLPDSFKTYADCVKQCETSKGISGLDNEKMWWASTFMCGRIFKQGRLQYEITRFSAAYKVFRSLNGEHLALCIDNDMRYDEDGLECEYGIYHPCYSEKNGKICGYGYDKLGRFEPRRVELDAKEWSPALEAGDYIAAIHIPGGSALNSAEVAESLASCTAFLNKYFWDLGVKAYTSYTWLLDSNLKRHLPEGSNILKFQEIFSTVLVGVDDKCIYDYIFRTGVCPLDELVPTNSFQRSVLSELKEGRQIRDGHGYILF